MLTRKQNCAVWLSGWKLSSTQTSPSAQALTTQLTIFSPKMMNIIAQIMAVAVSAVTLFTLQACGGSDETHRANDGRTGSIGCGSQCVRDTDEWPQ